MWNEKSGCWLKQLDTKLCLTEEVKLVSDMARLFCCVACHIGVTWADEIQTDSSGTQC